ncbi:uncharacterized protein LOC107795902 isoform X1 [Nicotiana tabacum]|uniref:Uncharacterized protein LOC107795902 isoform X1 n=2 Tax=Nicotiana TaxID=4085 RepID=A0A1S4ABV3_TOBAC|nr:PREDICTED: uncharacterized protein LOC104224898 isoform X1 [Nicotiana sylvestris]XP_016474094.1 PREDICTED: uncharacterized protein LOC107795902 isoform X1 [Nicotiana tabacum]
MKQVLLLLLLLLSTLVYESQGRHLKKGNLSSSKNPILQQENVLKERSEGGTGEVILCKDGHCSSSGRNRKLMTKTTSTSSPTTTSTKNIKNNEGNKGDHTVLKGQSSSERVIGGKEENFSVNSSPETGHRKTSSEHYPDVLDLAGMDYSPAKRKPPIHN